MRLANILSQLYNLPPRESLHLIADRLSGRGKIGTIGSSGEEVRTRYEALLSEFQEQFSTLTTKVLEGISAEDFRREIETRIGTVDPESEGYSPEELDRQRDLSIKFHWGHNHDFGTWKIPGKSDDRHIILLATFCSLFSLSPEDFDSKDILDIGCWTGGTSLMLALLGSKVHAIEEVRKYADMANFLAESFGFGKRISVESKSLYLCNSGEYHNRFDIIYFPGVIYHLSDPLIALRILYNACKPGGIILIETAGIKADEPICFFEGSYIHRMGKKKDLSRSGWNWFTPSPPALTRMLQDAGFRDIQTTDLHKDRFYAFARKGEFVGICRAGLSVPDIL